MRVIATVFPSFFSSQTFWFATALVAAIAKVLCTVISLRWPGGSENMLAARTGKFVYFAGKLTPVIAVGAVLMRVKLSDPTISTGWSLLAFTGVTALVAMVIWLRLANRWYGIAQMFKSSSHPRGGD